MEININFTFISLNVQHDFWIVYEASLWNSWSPLLQHYSL